MKRIFTSLMVGMIVTLSNVYAIDRAEALASAESFLKGKCIELQTSERSPEKIRQMRKGASPRVLIYNRIDKPGFVVIGGKESPEILGFSFDNSFDAEDVPEACVEVIEAMQMHIEREENHRAFRSPSRSTKGRRLVTPNWNQSYYPYALFTPHNVHAGCVPAAMAIIMGAWQWPVSGEGVSINSGSFYDSVYEENVDYNILLDHNVKFNLDLLPFVYDRSASGYDIDESLGMLLYHTSVAAEASYGENGTGAALIYGINALKDHFKFSNKLKYDYSLSYSEKIANINAELAVGRPLIVDTFNHALVLDGKWGDYYHFNFGWGGSSNGYYAIQFNDESSEEVMILMGVSSNLCPNTSYADYTPRSVEVAYDEYPEEEVVEIETSSDYSEVELLNNGTNPSFGLASTYSRYERGKVYGISASGLSLTGRFNGTESELPDEYVEYELAAAVVDSDGNMKYHGVVTTEWVKKNYISKFWNRYYIQPEEELSATDKIVLVAKKREESQWKIVKGLDNVTSELSATAPSSRVYPISLNCNGAIFSLSKASGLDTENTVAGEYYSAYIDVKRDGVTPAVRVNGEDVKVYSYQVGSTTYYYFQYQCVDEAPLKIEILPLSKSDVEVDVTVVEPGALERAITKNPFNISKLTVRGKIDVRDLQYISSGGFTNLVELDLGDSKVVEYNSLWEGDEIPYNIFDNLDNLKRVSLPHRLTSVRDYAFFSCYQIESLMIPAGVNNIGKYSFGQARFKEVWNRAEEPQKIEATFVRYLQAGSTLYVPLGSGDKYRADENWGNFENIFEVDYVGVNEIESDADYECVVRIVDGRLVVEGLSQSVAISVYSLQGAMLWQGDSQRLGSFECPGAMPLIVVVDGKGHKVISN